MKIDIPEFRAEELAERLGCSVQLVEMYNKAGLLPATKRISQRWEYDPITGKDGAYLGELPFYVYKLADVLKLEAVLEAEKQAQAAPVKEPDQPEAPEAMVERLRIEGEPDGVIAKALKSVFPDMNPSRIGRLITGTAADCVTTDAYRKRGKKLLK